jgi:hypothetical protein
MLIHDQHPLQSLIDVIQEQPDVRAVLRLAKVGDRYRYLIETPFTTFPRYVIGTCDANAEHPVLEWSGGTRFGAQEAWDGGQRTEDPPTA